eukprot:CCRYP_019194-RF/>CCRYP_019194-RF protein AED:0.45 eAED:1.00 QI:0/-1/0/1/-1/0/1/0/43
MGDGPVQRGQSTSSRDIFLSRIKWTRRKCKWNTNQRRRCGQTY